MWSTNRGDRILAGAEAELVSAAIDVMIDGLLMSFDDAWEEDPSWDCDSGVAVFDSLTATQRLALLHDVALHLLTQTDEPMPRTAASDAAVAAIFTEIRDQVAIEIDLSEHDSGGFPPAPGQWRDLVLQAYLSAQPVSFSDEGCTSHLDELLGDTELPDHRCRDIDQWEELIDALADGILRDRDFEMADSFLDVDPTVSQQRRRLMGISEQYFTHVARDPHQQDLPGLFSKTRALVRAKPR